MRMTVADLMCEMPVTLGPESTADQALEAFFEFETTEIYIVDKSGRLLGILPDYELLKAQLSGEAAGARVEDLMSRNVPCVKLDSDASEVVRAFRDSQCGRMPVIKSGRLVGVVTRNDVLRLMAVLRRIDPETTSKAPRAPKLLIASRPSAARRSGSKPTAAKKAKSSGRSKSTARRTTAKSR